MLADFKNSFTVGLISKFSTRLVPYFPPRLRRLSHYTLYLLKYNRSTIAMFVMYLAQYHRFVKLFLNICRLARVLRVV